MKTITIREGITLTASQSVIDEYEEGLWSILLGMDPNSAEYVALYRTFYSC